MSKKILVVDDDSAFCTVIVGLLQQGGFEAIGTDNGNSALNMLRTQWFDLILTDLVMPEMDGLEFLKLLQADYPEIPVIFLSGRSSVSTAVEALRSGATDFVEKPVEKDNLLHVVQRAFAISAPVKKERNTRWHRPSALDDIFGILERMAASNSPILILGETGVGKTRLAHQVHKISTRAEAPFITLDCGAIAGDFIEGELLGYMAGSFVGADRDRLGAAREAHQGTLFLDEISELPLDLQEKVLRLIQEQEVRPIGSHRSLEVNVRIIAATKHNLSTKVHEGLFRDDLYYRLAVLPITLPALNSWPGFIREMTTAILSDLTIRLNRPLSISSSALDLLEQHPWRGNIRELENTIQRLVLILEDDLIDAKDIQRLLSLTISSPVIEDSELEDEKDSQKELRHQRRSAEKTAIEEALHRANGNKTKAAQLLGIGRRTLYRKIEEFNMS